MKMIKTAYVLPFLLGPTLCYAGGKFGQPEEEKPTSVATTREVYNLRRQVNALESRVISLESTVVELRRRVEALGASTSKEAEE